MWAKMLVSVAWTMGRRPDPAAGRDLVVRRIAGVVPLMAGGVVPRSLSSQPRRRLGLSCWR